MTCLKQEKDIFLLLFWIIKKFLLLLKEMDAKKLIDFLDKNVDEKYYLTTGDFKK